MGWTLQAFPTQFKYVNLVLENWEETINSRIFWNPGIPPESLWDSSRSPVVFLPFGIPSESFLESLPNPYCAQVFAWTPQALPTQSYEELTIRKGVGLEDKMKNHGSYLIKHKSQNDNS